MRVLAALLLWALPTLAAACEDIVYDGNSYTLCTVLPGEEELRLFLYDDTGRPFGQFSAINRALREDGAQLDFAMNAGMYHNDRAPVGHYVEDGKEVMRVIPNPGPGNFGLLPNGVLCLRAGRADVFETLDFVQAAPECLYATQSGPMLVIDGGLHQRLVPDST